MLSIPLFSPHMTPKQSLLFQNRIFYACLVEQMQECMEPERFEPLLDALLLSNNAIAVDHEEVDSGDHDMHVCVTECVVRLYVLGPDSVASAWWDGWLSRHAHVCWVRECHDRVRSIVDEKA
eukprot:gnl/Trimastix_PCT/4019.p1 GENE.gnl/Trimastix_PCT/4019~~gnl/Trimastix_PCT/4019.p1  ORF type:complete len:122 (-),score=4.17 gnl/Trimastix_PCT/4019:234-599(-)